MNDQVASSACPTEEIVAAFLEGSLDGPSHAGVGAHIDGCESCREQATLTASSLGGPKLPHTGGVDLAPGHVLAERYRIVRLLGRGGMGEVFEVWDLALKVRVALKRIRPFAGDPTRLMARLRREVALGRRIHHPNVCRLYDLHSDVASAEGAVASIFLTMELLDGETLGAAIRRSGRFTSVDARRLGIEMASGVAAAHAAGVLLRDFKGENVMLVASGGREPRAVLTDFGLAVALEQEMRGDSSPSVEGAILGTFAYMAPEQVEGKAATAASDIYAVGVVLYEMLAGRLPFQGETPAKTALARLASPAPPLGELLGGEDRALERIVSQCLARTPEERFTSADALLAALAGKPEPSRHRRRPRRSAVAALVLAIAAAGSVGVFARVRAHRAVAASIAASGSAVAAPVVVRPALAILPPRGHADGSGREWLGPALEEMIRADCAHSGTLRVVSSRDVRDAEHDLSLDLTGELSAADLRRLQRRLEIRYLVETTYVVAGRAPTQLRVDARLLDARTGEAVASPSLTLDPEHLIDVGTAISREIRKALNVENVDASALPRALPVTDETKQLYLEALAKLRDGDAWSARTLLEKLLAHEPSFVTGSSALAEACRALGDLAAAQAAARSALDRGTSTIAREERLLLEALDAELSYDGAGAAETLRALVRFYPDNVEYVLALARVETSFGNAQGALASIAAHSKTAPGDGLEPRIELALAESYAKLGDATQQRKHAEASVALAKLRGARVLAALAAVEVLSARVSLEGGRTVIDDFDAAARQLEALGQPAGAFRANAERGFQLWRAGRHEEAQRAARTLRDQAIAKGNRLYEARGNQILGLSLQVSDRGAAYAAHEQSLAIYRAIGDKRGMASPLQSLGILDQRTDKLARAAEHFEAAREAAHAVGTGREEARALGNIAEVYFRTLQLSRGIAAIEEGRPLAKAAGDRSNFAYLTMHLGYAENERGNVARAEALEHESRALYTELANSSADGNLGIVRATSQTLRRDFAGAHATLDGVLKGYEAEKADEFIASAQLEIAALDIEEGAPNAGLAERGIALGRARAAPNFVCEGLGVLALSLALEGKSGDALEAVRASDVACDHLETETSRLRTAVYSGAALDALGHRPDARVRLKWAVERSGATGFLSLNLNARMRLLGTVGRAEWTAADDEARAKIESEARAHGLALYAERAAAFKPSP